MIIRLVNQKGGVEKVWILSRTGKPRRKRKLPCVGCGVWVIST
jgi:hypothetical protein